MFLRTSEFLWQEGHTAHADEAEARAEALKILELYRSVAQDCLAMPVVAGEKPEHERFPGAVATWSIEAMMQDGRALQAGTTHYLGTGFAEAAGIRYQTADGDHALCHTTSWGVSTRLIGGLIMTHGDDDGLRVPPLVAPSQIVIVPMVRGGEEDGAVLTYCRDLAGRLRAESAFGEPVRVLLDDDAQKASAKRWAWVKKGAPLILEVGPRDVAGGNVSVIRRDRLYTDAGKLASAAVPLRRVRGASGRNPARHPARPVRGCRTPHRRPHPRRRPPTWPRWSASTTAPRPFPAGWRCNGPSPPARPWTRWSSG